MIIPDLSYWQDDPTTPQGVDFGVMAQRVEALYFTKSFPKTEQAIEAWQRGEYTKPLAPDDEFWTK